MTPLVLVHGFMGGSAQWADQVAAFDHEFPVIALDLPGFGANSHLPAVRGIGDFAVWVMDRLQEMSVEKYHLLGHSMGGMIAQEISRRDVARVERVILYSTGAVGELPGRFETIEASKTRAKSDGAKATARRIAATWFLARETAQRFDECAAVAERATLEAICAGLDAMRDWSGEELLNEVAQDTLVLWGDRDRTYPWQQTELLWQKVPRSQLAVVPGCAHAVHMEKAHIFNAILRDYLKQN